MLLKNKIVSMKTSWSFKALIAAGTAVLSLAAGASAASADDTPADHYYIEVGGTGAGEPAPQCTLPDYSTHSYNNANPTLNGGIAVPVCYPASFGPAESGTGQWVSPGSPTYDDSVARGVRNALQAAEDKYHADPGARITITGYSQGAQVADEVLQTIANGGTDIPKSQVDGMLYADPLQPGTGLESVAPKGVGVPGVATSAGPGPVDFPGIPVERYCIHTDPVCDFTALGPDAINSVLNSKNPLSTLLTDVGQHTLYPAPDPQNPQLGNIIAKTLANDGGNGTTWYPPQ